MDEVVITIGDTTPPALTIPGSIIQEATAIESIVDIGQAEATDIADANPLVTSDAPDVYLLGVTTVTWTAEDANGNQATDTQLITVVLSVNHPPVLDPIGAQTVNEGDLLEFTINATDLDQDTLTYSASNLPSGATFDPQTRTFSWTPDYTMADVYENVHFEVTDGTHIDSEDITITVIDSDIIVIVELLDSQGTGIEGGIVKYAGYGWEEMGVTDSDGIASIVIPGDRTYVKVKMTYEGKSLKKTQDVQTDNIFTFQTVKAQVKLIDSQGAGIEGGEVRYAARRWRDFGTTDANGEVTKELLPSTYRFKAKKGRDRDRRTQNVSSNPIVELELDD